MTIKNPRKLFKRLMYWKRFLGLNLLGKKSLIHSSDQTVISCVRKCGFRNKAQDGDVKTLEQDEDEEFAGDVDLDNYVDIDKDIASLVPTVHAGSISWGQEIRKKKSLMKMKTQLKGLWMYQAMKTYVKRLKFLKEPSPLLTPCKIRPYGSLINLTTRNFVSQL